MTVISVVSVIVPTRNSARALEACLRSVREQSYRGIELIVVDNSSTDQTEAIARDVADQFVRGGPERSAQRNQGARVANGNWLFFVDSDMVLEPRVVEECVHAATDARAVIVPEVSFGGGFWARCKALERSCYEGDDDVEAARFVERELFERVGGFDETLIAGEDWDLDDRIRMQGARPVRVDARTRHDEGSLQLRSLISKKFFYGRELPRYVRKHPQTARARIRVIRPAFIRHWRRLVADPPGLLGMTFMRTTEIASGACGYAYGLLRGIGDPPGRGARR